MSKVAVLSRFKEKDDWWYKKLIKEGYDVVVFNKYFGDNLLPNVGRESHTYIHYIIENYDRLPDEILFSQYDPKDHFMDASKEQKHDSVEYFLKSYLYNFIGNRPGQFPYTARTVYKMPWIDIAKKIFVNFDNNDINRMVSTGAVLNGLFRVTRHSILNYNKLFYTNCINLLNKHINPKEGFFFERIWRFLFTNYGHVDNIKYITFIINQPLLYKHFINKSPAFNDTFGHIRLYSDGTVSSNTISYHFHRNERFWQVANDELLLFDYIGSLTNRCNVLSCKMPLNVNTYDIKKQEWMYNYGIINSALNY